MFQSFAGFIFLVAADDIFGLNMINRRIFQYHFLSVKRTVMAMATSYNWLFLWGYTFYKCGFLSTYNW